VRGNITGHVKQSGLRHSNAEKRVVMNSQSGSKKSSSKGNTKQNQKRIAKFFKASASLRKTVASQFKTATNRAISYRTSIAELGKSLTQLQDLCKKYKRPFRTVVSRQDYGIHMPVRTAYRYIKQVAAMHNLPARVVARVEAAGYDPASTRVAKAVRKLGKKVDKLTATELASALKKKGRGTKAADVSPLAKLQDDLKAAVARYLRATCDDETDVTQATEKALEYLDGRKINVNHGLTLVGKAA
jgi:hypothetical protein